MRLGRIREVMKITSYYFVSRIYIRKKKIKREEKMQDKGLDFKHKEVVNINNGKRLGYVQDVCADLETGTITSIIVPGSNKVLNLFSQNNEIVIPWQNIKCIGDDLILVEIWKDSQQAILKGIIYGVVRSYEPSTEWVW